MEDNTAQPAQLAQQLSAQSQAQQLTAQSQHDDGSVFKSGWRPMVGWICAGGLAYQFLFRPLVGWAAGPLWHLPPPPALDMGTLLDMLGGLIGFGTMRTVERLNGVIPRGQ